MERGGLLLIKALVAENGNNLICVLLVHFSCDLIVLHTFMILSFLRFAKSGVF